MAAPQMSPGVFDLRVWLQNAKALGQLEEVEGADLRYELGAITELNAKRGGPALLFHGFPGYPAGFRVLTGAILNATTLGLTLGLAGQHDKLRIVDRVSELLRTTEEKAKNYPAEFVSDGPVMENQAFGDDVDLTIFPSPIFHELDGGPFIGTGCAQINKDRDSEWVNVGTYRVQLFNKNTVGNFISPTHHGDVIRRRYWEKGEPSPVVITFGHHPLFLLMASRTVPEGVDELSWTGALAGQRVPVIRGPVTGLPIPAHAEIAVEGFAYPDRQMMEGPFGESTGYYAGEKKLQPCVDVKALYYRNDPVLLGTPPGRPPHDYSYYSSVMKSAGIKEALRKAGVPAVRHVWVSEASSSCAWIVTSIAQQYAGHAIQAANIAAFCKAAPAISRYSIVVDDDIDPTNNDDVIWALTMRSNPSEDIDIIRKCQSNGLDPILTAEAKKQHQIWTSRAIINACKPYERLVTKTYPAVAEATPELLRKTREKWSRLFNR